MARRKKGVGEIAFEAALLLGVLLFVAFKVPTLRAALNPFVALMGFGFAAVALLVILKKLMPRIKGKVGERIVSAQLRDGLPSGIYTVLDDVYLPVNDEGTTQVDHVVVSGFGVFVIETKNYSGWIYASANAPVWTQTIYREKNKFQNPIRQNYRHLCALSENLGISMDCLHGVIAFAGDCIFKTDMPDGVVYSRNAAAHIRAFDRVLWNSSEVAEVIKAIRTLDASVTPENRKAHVANLKCRHGVTVWAK